MLWKYNLCSTTSAYSEIIQAVSLCITNLLSFELLYGVIHIRNFTINSVNILNQLISRVTDLIFKSIVNWQRRRNCFHLRFVC